MFKIRLDYLQWQDAIITHTFIQGMKLEIGKLIGQNSDKNVNIKGKRRLSGGGWVGEREHSFDRYMYEVFFAMFSKW